VLADKQLSVNIDSLNETAWEVMLSEPHEALRLSKDALKKSKKSDYEKGRAESLLNIGWCHYYLGNFEKSLDNYYEALNNYRKLKIAEGEMKTLNALGAVHHQLSRLDLALEFYYSSLEAAKVNQNLQRQVAAYNNIGEICLEMGNTAEALNYYLEALGIAEKIADKEQCQTIAINIGDIYRNKKDYSQAGRFLDLAVEFGREIDNKISDAQCYTLKGLVLQEEGKLEAAEELHKESLKINKKTGHKIGTIDTLYNLGCLFTKRGEFTEALGYFKEALFLSESTKASINIYRCDREIALVYEQLGDYKNALLHYQRYSIAEREVKSQESAQQLKRLSMQYEIEQSKYEAEVARLKNIELKKKSEELEESYNQVAIISRIGQEITASLNLDELLNTIYSSVNKLMDANGFGIATYDEEKEELDYRLFIESGKRLKPHNRTIHSNESFGAWCIKNGEEIFLNDIEYGYKRYIKKRKNSIGRKAKALIYIPLKTGERMIGVLTVQSYKKNVYTEQHLEILRALASYISIALANSLIYEQVNLLKDQLLEEKHELENAYEQIAHMANHDNLTALPNRRLLDALMKEYMPLCLRNNEKMAILYLDLDDFKPINDNFGHECGDEALKLIAGRLRKCLRASDTIARIGGDEFAAVLINVKRKENIIQLAEKIIAAIRQPLHVSEQEFKIGVSIGVCIFPDDAEELPQLFKKADIAMYRVKQDPEKSYLFYNELESSFQ
jgi:diguanylate cyclase (GGDEF)-like protein